MPAASAVLRGPTSFPAESSWLAAGLSSSGCRVFPDAGIDLRLRLDETQANRVSLGFGVASSERRRVSGRNVLIIVTSEKKYTPTLQRCHGTGIVRASRPSCVCRRAARRSCMLV